MSIQLIVYPQSYEGFYNPIAGYTSEYIVDGREAAGRPRATK